ncbi:MAG: hypothetical protein ABEH81_01585 [Halopenitus sp.]
MTDDELEPDPADEAETRPADDWSLDGDDAAATASDSADSRSETAQAADQQRAPNTTDETTVPMSSSTQSPLVDAARLRQLLEYALLVTFVLVALFAALSFYSQVGRAIEIWVADPYQPIAKATVNLALLLIAVAGVSQQLARLAGRGSGGDDGAE